MPDIDTVAVLAALDAAAAYASECGEPTDRLLDALKGDSTLFMRADEIESAWEFITPILDA